MKVPIFDTRYEDIKFRRIEKIFLTSLNNGIFVGGEAVGSFEKAFSEFHGKDIACVGCGNGTQAIELILRGLETGSGDEVIVPTLTCVATVEPIAIVGAKPVFVDVLENGNIDSSLIYEKITTKTKAVIGVNLWGNLMDYRGILDSLKGTNIHVIEDCAQSHGSRTSDFIAGTVGIAAAYSFYPTKNLGAFGDAGAVISKDKELINRIREIANHGQRGKDNHVQLGINSRLDTLQAQFLTEKLKWLPELNDKRRYNSDFYINNLNFNGRIVSGGNGAVYHQFVIEVENRSEFINYMADKGIQTAIHYPYLNNEIEHFADGQIYPVAKRLVDKIVSIPVFPGLTQEELEYVTSTINAF